MGQEDIKSVVGKTVADADEFCKANGYTMRVVREDGRRYLCTAQVKVNRLNLTLVNGVITEVSLG
jgi:hypothetical protein